MKKNATGGEGKAPCLFGQCRRSIMELPKNPKEIMLKQTKNNLAVFSKYILGQVDAI